MLLHLHPKSLALLALFASKGLALLELPTTPPATKSELEEWAEEWRDYAVDAGLTDKSDKNNVARWIASDESGVPEVLHSG